MAAGTDTFSLTQLFAFLKEHSSIHILAPGCDEKLDKLADKFMRNDKKRGEIMKEAETAVDQVKCEKVNNFSFLNQLAPE